MSPHCRAGDNSMVSLAILQAGQKDQGLYYCCIRNSYGKVTAEFNLTAEGKPQLCHFQWKLLAPASSGQLVGTEGFLFCLLVLRQLSSHPDVKGKRIWAERQQKWVHPKPWDGASRDKGRSRVPISSSDQGGEGSGMPGKMRITHKLFQPNCGAYDEWVRLQVSSMS